MAPNILLSGPPEIVIRILNDCESFSQLLSLISTCKRVHSIWLTNMSTIIWHVGTNSIPAFRYALLAVRATGLIKEAIRARKDLPNPFPVDKLSGSSRKPTLSELKDLLNLQHLVRCIEYMCLTSEHWGATHCDWTPESELTREKSSSEMRIWRERFYRAIYRVFFAGAAFYRAYNEPFSSKAERPLGISREYLREYDAARDVTIDDTGAEYWHSILPSEGAQYLQRFTVYNTFPTEDQEKVVFDSFADWLVEDGKQLAEDNQCPGMWDLDSSQVSGVWEVMSMLKAYQLLIFLEPKFTNGDGQYGHGRYAPDDENPPRRQVIPGPTREVTIIPFGTFGIEDMSMPAVVADASEFGLIANPARVYRESEDAIRNDAGTPINVDIKTIQDYIFRSSGFWNHNDDHQMATLDLQLFKFTLKAHFNLQFKISTFDYFGSHRPWEIFITGPAIFHPGEGDDARYGFQILERCKARVLSYRNIS